MQGEIINIEKSNNITTIRIEKYNLSVLTKDFKVGERVMLRIKSTDLLICKSLPQGISALNYFKLQLVDIKIEKVVVTLYFKFNQGFIKASITKASLESLKLKKKY